MKLSFLGRTYNRTFPAIEVAETQETVKFLGQSTSVKRLTTAHRQDEPAEMRFLGRRYTR
jgi:hypothetical protein